MNMKKIAIIILNWNGKRDTLECLGSVGGVEFSGFKTIVVDNGSKDDSASAIRREFPWVEILETGENLGFAEGNNVGIRAALSWGAEACFLLNNDTIVDPHILTALSKGSGDVLGVKAYLYNERDRLDHFGGYWNPRRAAFDLYGLNKREDGVSWEEQREIDYACGCGLFVKRAVFEKIGLLDSRFFLLWEEADFCFRARRAGFKVMTCPQAKLWHKVSASFMGKPHSTYFWWRNRLLWIESNCSKREMVRLYFGVLLEEIMRLYKVKGLQSLQLLLLKVFTKRDPAKKREALRKTTAACRGVRDYFLRRFGPSTMQF